VLLTALAVGFAISLFQSVTQIQEATLSFVPKAAAVGAALLFSGNWMLHEMSTYTTQLFERSRNCSADRVATRHNDAA